jgi:hypothetical protein
MPLVVSSVYTLISLLHDHENLQDTQQAENAHCISPFLAIEPNIPGDPYIMVTIVLIQ